MKLSVSVLSAAAAATVLSSTTTTCIHAFQPIGSPSTARPQLVVMRATASDDGIPDSQKQQSTTPEVSRRQVFTNIATAATSAVIVSSVATATPAPANAVGPTKINLLNPTYTAVTCPKDKPIPGEKAMKGMKGLCVTVNVDLDGSPEKELEKVGVYGFVTDKGTGESVLANNPDLSTDAGQFAMIESVKPSDKKIAFEFIAAVPREMVRDSWICCRDRSASLFFAGCTLSKREDFLVEFYIAIA